MKINQYEFLRDGKPFEPTREEIIQFAEHELAEKDKRIKKLTSNSIKVKIDDEKFNKWVKQIFDEYTEPIKKAIRHQVCQEIRDCSIHKHIVGDVNVYHELSEYQLKQIEKGEKEC